MIAVPIRQSPSAQRSERPPSMAAPPPEVYTLMAAAQMHREGRLLASDKPTTQEPSANG